MIKYKKFLIRAGDHFDESNYLRLQEDMESIKAGIAHLPADFRSEMIISFAKDRSIQEELGEKNPSLTEKLNSKSLNTGCLEDLFDSASDNDLFREELEIYVRKMLH